MTVIKRDGRVQEFDIIKVRNSILSASIDSNTIINESDLKVLSNRVQKVINDIREEHGITSSYEIFAIIIETLNRNSFTDIAMSYLRYKSNLIK